MIHNYRQERTTASKPRILTFLPRSLLGLFLLPFCASHVQAFPFDTQLRRRDNSQSKAPTQIWVPIVVIALVLALVAVLTYRRGWRISLANLSAGAASAAGTTMSITRSGNNGARELTAEQLAGGATGGDSASQTGAQGRNARTGRARRTRRTPSQISTTSLPVYMKEPGDQELVIFRGPEDMEDVDMAVVMPPVEEDDDVEGPYPSADPSQASLGNPSEPDNSRQRLMPSGTGDGERSPRRSTDTGDTSEETSSLLQDDSPDVVAQDPRGEAPAYFEAVPLENQHNALSPTQPTEAASLSSPEGLPSSGTTSSRRLSGIRNLFSSLHPNTARTPIPPPPPIPPSPVPGHVRADSGLSARSLTSDGSHNVRTHRPSHSGGSLLNSSLFRTISRQRSIGTLNSQHLNSPSLISLNSISSPLSHTLVRTEITYPKSGPTPEQVKLISSRDSFARFGMPYGPDAIAFAASTSRQELEPPPGFDTIPESGNPGPSTRARSHSAQSSLSTNEHTSTSAAAAAPQETEAVESPSQDNTLQDHASGESTAVGSSMTTSTKVEPEGTVAPKVEENLTKVIEGLLSTSSEPLPPVITSQDDPEDVSPRTSSPESIVESTSEPVAHPAFAKTPPPSAYKPYPTTGTFESRASSVTSFATAAETMDDSSSAAADSDFDTPHPSEPSTPRRASQHLQEATDTTITLHTVPTTA